MQSKAGFWDDNIGGERRIGGQRVAFAVDRDCTCCGVCSDAAPDNFRLSEAEDHNICFKQPEGAEELAACEEAMHNCPVESIHDLSDGMGGRLPSAAAS